MCEPTTVAAIGSWFAGSTAATAGTVAIAETAAGYVATSTAASAALSAAQTAALAAGVIGAGASAYGAYQQSSTAAKVARNNAATAEQAAQEAQRRGEKEAIEVQRRAAQIKGSQRSVMAARGLDLTDGTAAALQDETDFFGAQDVATTRTNARRDAQGYRTQGANFRAEAGGYSPGLLATASLLNSGGQVADRWMRYRGA